MSRRIRRFEDLAQAESGNSDKILLAAQTPTAMKGSIASYWPGRCGSNTENVPFCGMTLRDRRFERSTRYFLYQFIFFENFQTLRKFACTHRLTEYVAQELWSSISKSMSRLPPLLLASRLTQSHRRAARGRSPARR